MKKNMMWVVGIILFAGAIRVPSIFQPLGPDQGIMSVIGEGILRGKLPYRDLWEMASPAIFYTYAAMFAVFGKTMAAIPIADTLVSMLTTFLIYLLGKSMWGPRAGALGAVAFALFSNGVRLGMHAGGDVAFGTFWHLAQRETFMMPLVTASYLLVLTLESHEGHWRLFFAGVLSGFAFLYKIPSLIFFAVLVCYRIWKLIQCQRKDSLRAITGDLSLMLVGFSFPVVLTVVFFAAKGALAEMTDVVFGYVHSVYGQARHDFLTVAKLGISHTLFLMSEQFVLWIGAFTASFYIFAKTRCSSNVLMVAWAAASVAYVTIHMEFFGYHYLMVLPPFCLLTGYGFEIMLGEERKIWRAFAIETQRAIVAMAILANLVVYTTLIHPYYTKAFQYITGKISKEQYYSLFSAYPKHDYSFPADYEVSQYIQQHTTPREKIFSLGGIESVIYFLSERDSPSRFIFSWILFSPDYAKAPQAERYRREMLADIQREPPTFIVTVRPLEKFLGHSGIVDYINEHYRLAAVFRDDRYLYLRQ